MDVLFLGINPSFSANSPDVPKVYSKDSYTEHPYFKAFKKVIKKLNPTIIKWTYLDLFAFQNTNQKYITNKLRNLPGGADFLQDQLDIAKKRIEFLNPKIIIASNALLRVFLGKEPTKKRNEPPNNWMGMQFEFDDKVGTYKIIHNEHLKESHVFFSSMLSGQGTLDVGSRERLIWHLNEVLK